MTKKFYAALISLVAAAAAALTFAGPADAAVLCDGHHQCQHKHKAARRTRQRARVARERARARRRANPRAVAYVCPMHPDIRERARGTCPKCLMDLVAEPRGARAGGSNVNAGGARAEAPASGGR
jgi:hypothetical protein